MTLSSADKAQIQSMIRNAIQMQPVLLYLYLPSMRKAIPAQGDDEGRLVIDPSDLDTRYHKKDEAIVVPDLGTSPYWNPALIFGAGDLAIRRSSNELQVMNLAGSAYRSVEMYTLRCFNLKNLSAVNVANIVTENNTVIATIGINALAEFAIPRAGDITALSTSQQITGFGSSQFLEMSLTHPTLPNIVFGDANDGLMYDRTNDRFLFVIGGVVAGYVDAAGFHDGAP